MESKETHRLRQRIHDCRGEGKLRDFGKVTHIAVFKMDHQQGPPV